MSIRILLGLLSFMPFLGAASAEASLPTPVRWVVFDLDRTLFNPVPRIEKILTELQLTTHESRSDLFDPKNYPRIKETPFGQKFYKDASYLTLDLMIPGAAHFVWAIKKEAHAKVLYLSGRIQESFQEATWNQLEAHGFPGRAEARLILKPAATSVSNAEFKATILKTLPRPSQIIAVFDDSTRNLQAFQKHLNPSPLLVKMTQSTPPPNSDRSFLMLEDFAKDQKLLQHILKIVGDCGPLLLHPEPPTE